MNPRMAVRVVPGNADPSLAQQHSLGQEPQRSSNISNEEAAKNFAEILLERHQGLNANLMMKDNERHYCSLACRTVSRVAVCGGCGSQDRRLTQTPTASRPIVDVTTAQAVVKPIPTYFEATGNLASDAATDVAPNVAGKIPEVNFDVGSFVTKGSVLVRLDPRDAQIRLEQARHRSSSSERRSNRRSPALRQAQARLGIKDGETFNIETFSQVKIVKANLELAEKELDTRRTLFETGDFQDRSRSAACAARRPARPARRGSFERGRRSEGDRLRRGARSRAARAGVADSTDAGRAGTKGSRRHRDLSRRSAAMFQNGSPIPANTFQPSAPNTKIATIVRTSPLRLKIDVPEASIGKVAVGQGISLQTSAYPDRNFAGTVARILPSLNATASTLTVEAEVAEYATDC